MKRYEIWEAEVRFEDEPTIKKRPVMIWNDVAFVMAYKLTGTDRGDNNEEFRIEFWKEAGLSKPTSIRISKLLKLEHVSIKRKIGELDMRDRLRFELRIVG
ncbi:MAG: PemK family transcriptional regulator [Lachnospiraceae bacterium]|nr:PemK family transcriptional regulator [Lachnospiraceae bacterium]